ncbi:unnamed protein product, partial [Prorocentrum cordatum]
AHWKVEGIKKRMVVAVGKHDELETQFAAQRSMVVGLRQGLIDAENEHKALVQCLVQEQAGPAACSSPVCKLSLEDVMDQERLSQVFDIKVCDLFKCDDFDLDEEDCLEIESRVKQLKKGLSTMAGSLFSEAKQKVDELRAAHRAH